MYADMLILTVVIVVFATIWVCSELYIHKEGGDVQPWVSKLAMFLKGK
jgi:RsiW-degrading membrane proteinase PrsW (M82 family)